MAGERPEHAERPEPLLPTGSHLSRAMACPASVILPRTADRSGPAAERGKGLHAFFAALQTMSRDEALDTVPEDLRAACEAVDVAALPTGLEYDGEVSLAYDIATERVRYLGRDLERRYGLIGPTEVAMTLDVLGVGPDCVEVADYKTGRGHIDAAAANWQLRVGALAAARWRGVERARVAIVRVPIGPDGTAGAPSWDTAEFDAFDLDAFASDLRAALPEWLRPVESARVVPGEHCRYCPAYDACPAQRALVRTTLAEPGSLVRDIQALLTAENAPRAYERLRLVDAAMKQVREALYAYASVTPIPLPDGTVFGRVESSVEELDGGVTRAVLRALHGDEVADRACTYETSKAAVERAMRVVYEARKQAGEKVTIRSLVDDVLARVREAGGVAEKTRVVMREYREHRGGGAR